MDKRFFYFFLIGIYLISFIGNRYNNVYSENGIIDYLRLYSHKSITSICYDTKRDKIFIAFSNKTIALYDLSKKRAILSYRKSLEDVLIKCQYVSSLDEYISISETGKLYIFDPTSLRLIREENIVKKDETIFTFTVTNNGRYLVIGLKFLYKGAALDRLVIISLASFKRVYVWDIYSKENKLVQLFYLKSFLNDLVVVEYIDTICELCELTEARIAVLNTSSKRIIYEKMIGLSDIYIDKYSKKIIAVRYTLDMKDMSCPYIIVDAEKWDEKNGKVPGKIISTALRDNKLFFLYESLSKNKEYMIEAYYLDGKLYFQKKVSERGFLCFLNEYLVYATISKIVLFEGPNVVKKIVVDNTIPPRNPETYINPRKDIIIFKFGQHLLYILWFKNIFRLSLYVYDQNHMPLKDVNVTIILSNKNIIKGVTDSNGYYSTNVIAGLTRIEIDAKGYVFQSRNVYVIEDVTIKVFLKKKVSPRTTLIVNVLDNEKRTPIKDVFIRLVGDNENYFSEITNEQGFARFDEIERGIYILSCKKDSYIPRNVTITLNESVVNVTILLNRITYNVTINVITNSKEIFGNSSILLFNTFDNTTIYRNITEKRITIYNIKPGVYELNVFSKICPVQVYNMTKKLVINDNISFSLFLSCRKNSTTLPIIDPYIVIKIVNKSVQYSKIVNFSFTSFTASTPDGKNINIQLDNSSNVYIIEFFYTRCEGCKYLIPVFKSILNNSTLSKYVKIYSLTVNPSDNEYLINMYIKENNITWMILKDSEYIYNRLNVSSYPTVLIIYKGKIIYIGIGAKEELTNVSKFEEVYKILSNLNNLLNLLYENIGIFFIVLSMILLVIYWFLILWDKRYFEEE